MRKDALTIADEGDLGRALPARDAYASKHDNGRVLIIGGSSEYHGAPALASNAAYALLASLRVGIGYATAFVPRSIVGANRKVSPNIIVRPLSGGNLAVKDVPALTKLMDGYDCTVIGPGMGREKGSLKAASRLMSYALKKKKRMVVDADALHAVSFVGRLGKSFILTPNENEFGLFAKGVPNSTDLVGRTRAAMLVSNRLNANILLKGHETIVTDGKRVRIVKAKRSNLATMGTGDVLSGIIAGFAAKNDDMFVAGVAAAYLHSRIGDELYKSKGNHILASDVIDLMPEILRKFDRS